MVSGSNLGELIGAAFVLVTTTAIPTPMPFLRFDALALLIIWVLPSYSRQIVPNDAGYAWRIAGMFIPVSMGWAAGDVSLAAFIQASLARMESEDPQVSALGSVMAFLYSSYIITYAVLGYVLGSHIDDVYNTDKNVERALRNLGGIQVSTFNIQILIFCSLTPRLASQFTVLAAIVIAATFVPKGSFSLNPKMINDSALTGDVDAEHGGEHGGEDVKADDSSDEKTEKPVKSTDIGAMIG